MKELPFQFSVTNNNFDSIFKLQIWEAHLIDGNLQRLCNAKTNVEPFIGIFQ